MKTQKIFLVLAILVTSLSFGQITTDPVTGYVGIGTSTPQSKLDIDFGGEPKSIKFLEYGNAVSSMNSLMRFTWYNDTADFGMIRSGGTPIEALAIRFNSIEKIRFMPNGNVGIGTSSPTYTLQVVGATGISEDLVLGGNGRSANWSNFSYGSYIDLNNSQNALRVRDKNNTIMLEVNGSNNYFTGNLGIGTSTPAEKLTVGGNILASTSLNFQDNSKFTVTNASVPSLTLTPFSMPQYGIAAPNTAGSADLWISGHNAIRMFTGGNPNPTVNILSGKVGIGSLNPDEMLTVKGKIHAQEVRVDLQGSCTPDYVFQKYYTGKSALKSDYVMPTLAEIENFTKKNNHLPGVPSAQEVQQNGLSLGEMSNVLLQKVEELTLYAIEQENKLKEQNQTIEMQSKLLEALTKRLDSLEKK